MKARMMNQLLGEILQVKLQVLAGRLAIQCIKLEPGNSSKYMENSRIRKANGNTINGRTNQRVYSYTT